MRRQARSVRQWLMTVQLVAALGAVVMGAQPAARVARHHWRQWRSAAAWETALRLPPTGASGEAAGFLRAPGAKLAQMVVWDASKANLRDAPCVESHGGLTVILGHRDTHFRRLERLEEGDKVRWSMREPVNGRVEERDYRVLATQVLTPEALEARLGRRLEETRHGGGAGVASGARLALVTCHPFQFVGPAPNRYVVWLVDTND